MIHKRLHLLALVLTLLVVSTAVGGAPFYCALEQHGAFATTSCNQGSAGESPTHLPQHAFSFVQMLAPRAIPEIPEGLLSYSFAPNEALLSLPVYDIPPLQPPRYS